MLQRKFLHPKLNLLELPKNRLIGGIFIGVFHAVIWYAFLYLSREAVRIIFSIYPDYNIAIFTDAEVNFYNLFFPFIAVILGQSACIQFWLERPRRFGDKHYRRKVSIVHEQKALNWIFMFVFSKTAMIIGAFAATSLWSTKIFNFSTEYRSIFILTIIVLYLNTWNSIRHLFKNASLKWMLISIFSLSSFAFILSQVNLINHKEINHIILQKDVSYNYNIQLVESNIYRNLADKYMSCPLTIAFAKDNSKKVLFFNKNKSIQLEEITNTFDENRLDIESRLQDRMIIHAKVDKNIKMNIINDVKKKLTEGGFNKINYAIEPSNSIYNYDKVFNYKIPNYPYHSYLKNTRNGIFKHSNFYEILPSVNNGYSINGIYFSSNELKAYFNKIILDKKPYVLEYYINDDMTFDHYLQFHIAYRSALLEVWDEFALNEYLMDNYYALPSRLKKETQEEYPLSIYEITEEMLDEN